MSVQTGTSHGGVPLPDGGVTEVKLDFEVLRELGVVAREYGLAGAVQHGASTLLDELFHQFPAVETAEIHLATGFQNALYEHPAFPEELHREIHAWCFAEAIDERKPDQTDQQFVYTTRKKAIGPFKRQLWDLDAKDEILAAQRRKIAYLYTELGINNSLEMVNRYVQPVEVHRPVGWSAGDRRSSGLIVPDDAGEPYSRSSARSICTSPSTPPRNSTAYSRTRRHRVSTAHSATPPATDPPGSRRGLRYALADDQRRTTRPPAPPTRSASREVVLAGVAIVAVRRGVLRARLGCAAIRTADERRCGALGASARADGRVPALSPALIGRLLVGVGVARNGVRGDERAQRITNAVEVWLATDVNSCPTVRCACVSGARETTDPVLVGAGDIADCGLKENRRPPTSSPRLMAWSSPPATTRIPMARNASSAIATGRRGAASSSAPGRRWQPRTQHEEPGRLPRLFWWSGRPRRKALVLLRPRDVARDRARLEL